MTLVEGGKNIVDFIAADAPAFKDKDASLADSSLLLATDPEPEDGVVTIAVGENVTVTAQPKAMKDPRLPLLRSPRSKNEIILIPCRL